MRILHTMIRVTQLERSLHFYTEILGMQLLRQRDYPEGFQPENEGSVLELTYNWDTDAYQMGDAFGHIAIAVDDVYAACERIRAMGGTISREPGPMKHGSTLLAFVKDPDGYAIELLEAKQ